MLLDYFEEPFELAPLLNLGVQFGHGEYSGAAVLVHLAGDDRLRALEIEGCSVTILVNPRSDRQLDGLWAIQIVLHLEYEHALAQILFAALGRIAFIILRQVGPVILLIIILAFQALIILDIIRCCSSLRIHSTGALVARAHTEAVLGR